MWKLLLAFVVFAALAVYMLSKGGDIDMSGEKHGIDSHAPAASETASAPAAMPAASEPVAAPAASAASQ
jgi:hypothetical protein